MFTGYIYYSSKIPRRIISKQKVYKQTSRKISIQKFNYFYFICVFFLLFYSKSLCKLLIKILYNIVRADVENGNRQLLLPHQWWVLRIVYILYNKTKLKKRSVWAILLIQPENGIMIKNTLHPPHPLHLRSAPDG